ncbi:MAG: hypothetical protein AAF799_41220 [Myxococcota bacterium]
MQAAKGKCLAGVVIAMALAGCGNEKCDALGKHMADVVLAEAADKAAVEDKREDIVKKTIEACQAEPPEEKALDCALKAKSTAEMKACEADDEKKADEEKKD